MIELKQRKGEFPAKYARRARRIADHIDPKHDNILAIKFRDGFRSKLLKRHLSISDATGKTSFELIYKRFIGIDRFEQKIQRKKSLSDPFDSDSSDSSSEPDLDTDSTPKKKEKKKKDLPPIFESDDSSSPSSEDELVRKKKMKKQSTQKDPVRESMKNLWTSRLDCGVVPSPNTPAYEAEVDAVGPARQYQQQHYRYQPFSDQLAHGSQYRPPSSPKEYPPPPPQAHYPPRPIGYDRTYMDPQYDHLPARQQQPPYYASRTSGYQLRRQGTSSPGAH